MSFSLYLTFLFISLTVLEQLPLCEPSQQYVIPGQCENSKRLLTFVRKEFSNCIPSKPTYSDCSMIHFSLFDIFLIFFPITNTFRMYTRRLCPKVR